MDRFRCALLLAAGLALQACATGDDYVAGSEQYSCGAQVKLGATQVSAFRGLTEQGRPVGLLFRWERPLAWVLFVPRGSQAGFSEVRVNYRLPGPAEAMAKADELIVNYLYTGDEDVWLVARMGDQVWRVAFDHPCRRTRDVHCGGAFLFLDLKGPAFDQAYARGEPLEVYLQRADGTVLDRRTEPMADREKAATIAVSMWRDVQAAVAQFRTRCDHSVTIPEVM